MSRGRPLLVLAFLLLASLAGCLSADNPEPAATGEPAGALDPLTEPTMAFGKFLSLKAAAEDGVLLHVDVQLPDGEGPFPTILEYTPYSVLGEQAWALARERLGETPLFRNSLADYYVPRGYAVGVAHVRGTGESGGCLTVGGENEGKDGYAIVEHLAQQAWSNGKIALVGTSYVGTTPIETAVLNPPHLTTIIPVAAVTEWYRYYFENGEQRMNGAPPPGASYPDPAFWFAMGLIPGPRTLAASPDDASCVAEYTRQFWLQDDYNAFWEERNISQGAANITIPTLYVQGWKDENVASNMIPRFWGQLQAEKRAWFMQVGHGVPASRENYYQYEHRWLDHWLMGKQNGALDAPPVIVEDNRGKWRGEADWPPADQNVTRLWLTPDGALAAAAPGEGKRSFVDDGGSAESRAQARPAVEGTTFLRFVGEPVEAPMHVAGEPLIHLQASSSARDTQFSVLVYDVAPDGTQTFLTRGYLDARHRDTLASGEDLAPGERYAFQWLLHPRDHVVEKGHRLAVVVKSSDPYVIPDETRATNTIHMGPDGSWIEVPIIPVEGRTYLDEAPRPATWA